ncbi:MAG: hypothetical protein WEA24_05845 [Gemmatimonadota bacterium]
MPREPAATAVKYLLPAGVAALVLGMALVFAGVAGLPFFRAGTWTVALGLLLVAAAAILRVIPRTPPAR